MSNIKEFKPKPAEPVVDEHILKTAQALVERVKSGTLVGVGIVMVERGTYNVLHSWGGDCPRASIVGGLEFLKNRIIGNVQEDWATPYMGDGPQAEDMPGSSDTVREAMMSDLPDDTEDGK